MTEVALKNSNNFKLLIYRIRDDIFNINNMFLLASCFVDTFLANGPGDYNNGHLVGWTVNVSFTDETITNTSQMSLSVSTIRLMLKNDLGEAISDVIREITDYNNSTDNPGLSHINERKILKYREILQNVKTGNLFKELIDCYKKGYFV